MSTLTDIFGPPIHVYTVADGIRDGVMVEAPEDVRTDAGYRIPVVFTAAAWADLVEWDGDGLQDETGRLWDVLTTMRAAAKASLAAGGQRRSFDTYRVPLRTPTGKRSRATTPQRVTSDLVVQAYDAVGTPCITVLTRGED